MSNKISRNIKLSLAVILAIVVSLLCSFSAFAQSISYEMKDIGMTISIPENMQVITRDLDKNSEVFKSVDYDSTMNSFEESDIYLEALDSSNNLMISVSVTTTEKSKNIDNCNNLSQQEFNQIKNGFVAESVYKVSSKSLEINGCKYWCFTTKTRVDGKVINIQQYNTVVNGSNYMVTLQGSNGQKLTKPNKESFNAIMNTVIITKPSFFALYGGTILVTTLCVILGLALVGLIIIIIKRIIDPKRKHDNLVHKLAHEHLISETTQIPRKKLRQYMLDNAPEERDFMEEYEPLGTTESKGAEKSTLKFSHVSVSKQKSERDNREEIVAKTQEFNGSSDYFAELPKEREMYVYSDVSSAVQDYKLAKRVQQQSEAKEAEQKRYNENPVLKVLIIIGKGILKFLQGVGVLLIYLVVHIRYFVINLYRLIKRKIRERKRRKIIEERRQKEEYRQQMRREAELRRRRQNAQRGENDLVQVRSRSEGITYPRSGYSRKRRR